MKLIDIEGSRDEVIDRIAEELKTRLLAQVLDQKFRPTFLAIGKALEGHTATFAMAVISQVMVACADNLKHLIHIEPSNGETWSDEYGDELRRDIVMRGTCDAMRDTMEIVPANAQAAAQNRARLKAMQKAEKAHLNSILDNDVGSDTKH